MKFNSIATFGCSFVYGANINTYDTKPVKWVGDKFRLSKILSEHYSTEEFNLAYPGYGNESILTSFYKFYKNNTDNQNTLFIFGLSGITRMQLWHNRLKEFTNVHLFNPIVDASCMGKDENIDQFKQWVEFYKKYFFRLDYEYEKLEREILFLDSFLKKNKVKYLLFNSLQDNLSPEIKKQINFMTFNLKQGEDCWYEYGVSQHIKTFESFEAKGSRSSIPPYGLWFCGGHPSPYSHKCVANKIIKYIDEIYS